MNMDLLREFFDSRMPDYLAFLELMVATNSFTSNVQGIERLSSITADAFTRFGFQAESVPCRDLRYGSHLFLSRGSVGKKGIIFVSHLDTVFSPEEERRNDFKWKIDRNRIYGPGTIDIKGGTLVGYMMLDAFREFCPKLFDETTWLFGLNAAEEVGVADFRDALQERAPENVLACLVLEAGKFENDVFRLVTSRKGRAPFRVDVYGRAAHSGTSHERGANAIHELARVVEKIEALTDYQQTLTCNVGVIGGGECKNRVPHHAWAEGEIRSFHEGAFLSAQSALQAFASQGSVRSPYDNYACRINVTLEENTPSWPSEARGEALFSIWKQTAQKLGFDATEEARGGLSDANWIWTSFPTLDGLGPAGGNEHCSESSDDGSKDQEYLDVPKLLPKALLNTLAVFELLQA